MGTCSYVLTGTQQGMNETFGSTCHGAVSVVVHILMVYMLHVNNVIVYAAATFFVF